MNWELKSKTGPFWSGKVGRDAIITRKVCANAECVKQHRTFKIMIL